MNLSYLQHGAGSSTTPSFVGDVTEYDYGTVPDDDFGRCDYERPGARFLPALYSIVFLTGLVGNSLVIWVSACSLRLRSMTDVCLLNLAIADLLLVCTLPFLAHQARDQWLFGDPMCKAVLGVYQIVLYSGIFFVSVMSVDRYLAVVHAVYAMRARTRSLGITVSVVTWAVGLGASFPDLIFLKQQSGPNTRLYCFSVFPTSWNGTDIQFWRLFSLFKMNVLGLFIPTLVMGFCYSRIIWCLFHSPSSKRRAIRLVLIVVAAFCCCWVPYNVASMFSALELLHVYEDCESSKTIRLAVQVTEVLAYMHSCLNPVLYVFVGERFRRSLLRCISRAPCRLCQLIKVVTPQDGLSRSFNSQTISLHEGSTHV